MDLREKLVTATEHRIKPDASLLSKSFKFEIGDSFNSGIFKLVNEQFQTLDDLIPDNVRWFLPSVLKRNGIAFVNKEWDLDKNSLYRFKIVEKLNDIIGNIQNVFIAEPIAILPKNTKNVSYLHKHDKGDQLSGGFEITPVIKARKDPNFRHLVRGGAFPPYPPNCKLPKYITDYWITIKGTINYYILKGNPEYYSPQIGDLFNAIVMAHAPDQSEFRLWQFRPLDYLGFAKIDTRKYETDDVPTLPYPYLRVKYIFPFEVIDVWHRKGKENIFYARAVYLDFKCEPFDDPIANGVYNMTHVRIAR